MAVTASISWTPAVGNTSQELFYGKDSLVTGKPGAGTNWETYPFNPLSPTTNTASINTLVESTKYRFLIKSTCPSGVSWIQASDVVWLCPTFTPSGVSGGGITYSLTKPLLIPFGLGDTGSSVNKFRIKLVGIERNTFVRVYKEAVYTAPFSSSYTGSFLGVIGEVDWTISSQMEKGNTVVYECTSSSFATSTPGGTSIMAYRNGTAYSITEVLIGTSSRLGVPLLSGESTLDTVTSFVSGPNQIKVAIPAANTGDQFVAKLIRNGASVFSSTFSYTGAQSLISPVAITVQDADILQIAPVGKTGVLSNQLIARKVTAPSNGYYVKVRIDLPQGGSVNYDTAFTIYDFASGVSQVVAQQVTIPAGQVVSNEVFVPTTLTSGQFADAIAGNICVTPSNSNITIPGNYIC